MPTAIDSIVETMAAAIAAATPLSRPGLRFERGPAIASLEQTAMPARSRIFDVAAGRVIAIGDFYADRYELEQEVTAQVTYLQPSQDEAWRALAHETAEDLALVASVMMASTRELENEQIRRLRLIETKAAERRSGRVTISVTIGVIYLPQ